jgi:hypothetical protein
MRSKPPTPEALLTRSVRQLLNAAGVFHFKHWGGPMGEKGISDIIGCMKGGRMIAIELKSPKGEATPAQLEFIDRVNAAGGIGLVARTIDEVIEGLSLQDRFLLR